MSYAKSYSKEFTDGVKKTMLENRKHNGVSYNAEQKIEDMMFQNKSKAPFLFYLKFVLKRGDKPPRGKFFKNRVAGTQQVFCDEYWHKPPITSRVEQGLNV